MAIDSTTIQYTSYDPSASGTSNWIGSWHEWYGGIYGDTDDVLPGTSANPVQFNLVQYQWSSNSGNANLPSYTVYNPQSCNANNYIAVESFKIWHLC